MLYLHRVILNMASTSTIQGPVVGTNFANAGYYALDSSTNGLLHSNGVISVANAGPNTDGSQFFITVTNYPFWDGNYTVFGHVVTGREVVMSIAAVALQSGGDRPLQDVALSNIVVRRVGTAAENFDVTAHGLPVVDFAGIRVAATGGQARVRVEIPPYSETKFRVSTNGLQSWSLENWGYASNAEFQVVQVATRKGFPGTRALAIKAVLAGGGSPHRLGLSETVLVFGQHRALLATHDEFFRQIPAWKARAPEKKFLVEAEGADDALAAVRAGADGIQFDKLPPSELAKAVPLLRAVRQDLALIAAGGIVPGNVAAYAATGVDALATSTVFHGPARRHRGDDPAGGVRRWPACWDGLAFRDEPLDGGGEGVRAVFVVKIHADLDERPTLGGERCDELRVLFAGNGGF